MKWSILVGVVCLAMHSEASFLDVSSATLNWDGVDTSSSSPTSALSVQSNAGGEVLVIGTFSARASAKVGTGEWQLSNGENSSLTITRSLNSKSDFGIGSVVHVFDNVVSGSSIDLMHRTTGANTLTTLGGNLLSIPLTVSTGEKLNHDIGQQISGFSTSSTTFQDSNVKATVSLDRASNNGMYMAASFNAQTLTVEGGTGNWQLQYRLVGATEWNDTGNTMTRAMSSAGDIGSVTLYALEEGLAAGEYEVQLACKSEAGAVIETLNGTLAAVSLSYTNATGGGYFDGFMATSTALSDADKPPYTGVSGGLTLDGTGDVVASMSFSGAADTGANQTGAYDLFLTNDVAAVANQSNIRSFDASTDWGSGGTAGHFSDVAAGDFSLFGRSDTVSGPVQSKDITLVGFSTESIPEPSVLAFVLFSGVGLIAVRRLFSR